MKNLPGFDVTGRIHLLFKTVSFLIVFSFLFYPIAPVFAQENLLNEASNNQTSNQNYQHDSQNQTQTETSIGTNSVQSEEVLESIGNNVQKIDVGINEEDIQKFEEIEEEMSMNSIIGEDENGATVSQIEGGRSSIKPTVDENTGALRYSYPITVPPGRNGLTPSISIDYNSQNIKDGSIFGYGWETSIPYIERINKHGTNELFGSTYNDFRSSFDDELVSVSGGVYAPKVENGDFRSYSLSSNVWTVTDKMGTVYTFGGTSASRQDNPSDSTQISKWMVSKIEDTNGNKIEFTYSKDFGQIYPDTVSYVNNGSAYAYSVTFTRSSSASRTSYERGFSVTTRYTITSIKVYYDVSLLREYTLAYSSPSTTRPFAMLVSITDATTLPTTTSQTTSFAYSDTVDAEFEESSTYQITDAMTYGYNGEVMDTTTFLVDYNGDGLPDLTTCSRSTSSCHEKKYYRNTGTQWVADTTTITSNHMPDEAYYNMPYAYVTDVDGDGMEDVLIMRKVSTDTSKLYRGTGAGWVYDSSVSIPNDIKFGGVTGESSLNGWKVAHLNGDGIIDFIEVMEDQYVSGNWQDRVHRRVFLSNGLTWTESTTEFIPQVYVTFSDYQGVPAKDILVDTNADALMDAFRYSPYDCQEHHYNNAHGWNSSVSNNYPCYGTFGAVLHIIADFNGDTYPDVLEDKKVGSTYVKSTLLAQHDGNVAASSEGPTFDDIATKYTKWGPDKYPELRPFRIADIDGDGLNDIMSYSNLPTDSGWVLTRKVYINSGEVPGVLNQITLPAGGTNAITYKTSPQYLDGSGNLLNPKLQFPVRTVSSIATTDAVTSTTGTTSYSYKGGGYYFNSNALDKKFAGFEEVTITDPVGNKTVNYYHQGNATNSSLGEYDDHSSKIGKKYRSESKDSSGNIYDVSVTKWEKTNLGTGRDFVYVARQTNLTHDGNTSHRDTAETYTYDTTNGNLTGLKKWGEVIASTDGSFTDTGSDIADTTISYASSGGSVVIGLPKQESTVDQSSAKVSETKYYYDTLSHGSVDEGNLTKTEKWKVGTTYVDDQTAYNSYGLPTSKTDERGKVTTYSYDSHNLYPTTVTNPLSQATVYTYEYAFGKVKTKTDPNNKMWETSYDGRGRILTEKIPGFISPYTPVTKTTYVYTDTANAVAVQKTDYIDVSIAVDSYQYFDGLNRLIQERSESESGYNVRDIAYTAHGYKARETLPYVGTGSARTTPTSTNSLYTRYDYDPLGRITTTTNAVGTATNTYDDWSTYVTDLNGNQKKYGYDAYKRLINVDEFDGALSIYSTYYDWNLNDKLTKITDASGNIRNFAYDGLGRRTSVQDLHAPADLTYGTWNYTYDNAGNMTQSVSPNAATINYTYDDVNRILTENYTGAPGTEIGYVYDTCANGVGKLCDVNTLSGADTSYTYDSAGNRNSEDRTINGTTYTTSYDYDYQGSVSSITYPDSAEVHFIPNSAGLLEKIEWKENGGSFADIVSDIDYSPLSQKTYIAYGNGATTTNTYDAAELYRLRKTISTDLTPTNVQDITYTYDGNGNITQIVDASGTKAAKTAVYVYDDLNRLTSATITGVPLGQTPYTHTLTYSGIGNITNKSNVGNYLYQGSSGTNWANPHAATSINGVTVTYDKNGNMLTHGPGMTNTWNYKNELTRTVVPGKTIEYLYDHEGNRVSYDDGTTVTDYANKLYNTDGTDITKDIYAGDVLVATIETVGGTATPHYVHTDNILGSNVITDASGILEQTLDYYPFGEVRIDDKVGVFGEKKQYTGHEFDSDTGLNYAGARYLNTGIGRFISQDPVFWFPEKFLEDPQVINSYSYARNNPLIMVDPDGKNPVLAAIIVGFATLFRSTYAGETVYPDGSISMPQEAMSDRAYANEMMILVGTIRGTPSKIMGTRSIPTPEANLKTPTKAQLNYQRQQAVKDAWKQEVQLVKDTGEGTYQWTEAQIAELMTVGKVKGFEGHHINSVNAHPELARNPDNIKFVPSKSAHLEAHNGSFKNPTSGDFINRGAKMKQ